MQLSWSSSSCIRTSSMSTEPDGEEFGKHTTFLTGRIGGMTYEAERICRPVYWLECYCFPRSLDTNELGVRRLNERRFGNGSSHDGDSNLDWQTVILEAIV